MELKSKMNQFKSILIFVIFINLSHFIGKNTYGYHPKCANEYEYKYECLPNELHFLIFEILDLNALKEMRSASRKICFLIAEGKYFNSILSRISSNKKFITAKSLESLHFLEPFNLQAVRILPTEPIYWFTALSLVKNVKYLTIHLKAGCIIEILDFKNLSNLSQLRILDTRLSGDFFTLSNLQLIGLEKIKFFEFNNCRPFNFGSTTVMVISVESDDKEILDKSLL